MPKDMSWLSPKRRRTTGNLKTLPNGQVNSVAPNTSAPSSPLAVRPLSTHRPFSQPETLSSANDSDDGNLFYAYARKGDDLKSRYLLTFASASVATEWWLLLQTNFPDTSRPGPQLFSFQTDDLLTKAWRHPSFSHLKSKWMYISFSDAPSEGFGGAAQGIIPVQDAQGNMLGGSTSPDFATQVKKEAHEVKTEVQRMEEYFSKMMAAVERNTEKVTELVTKRGEGAGEHGRIRAYSEASGNSETGSVVDMGVLSGHFVRMNDLLSKNSQHVETLTKKHYDNEQKLRQTMEGLISQRKDDYLDMQQLSSHLDRIQETIEASVKERKDSAREISEQQLRASQIDFSPLTERLEKVQEAVEQNSALVKALLDEGAAGSDSRVGTPFWGKEQSTQPDLSPLTQHLERIYSAIEQQSEHMKALVGFASGESHTGDDSSANQASVSLAPLGEHLEQIYNAIEEGNKHAKEVPKLDLEPLSKHLEALRQHSEKNNSHIQELLESHNTGATPKLDLEPLNKHMEALRDHSEKNINRIQQLLESQNTRDTPKLDFEPLSKHLEALRKHSEKNNKHIQQLLESQNATREAVVANGGEIDFTPVAEHLEAVRDHFEKSNDHMQQLLEAQNATREAILANGGELDFTPMAEHLEAIRESSNTNAETIKRLLESQEATRRESNIDFTPLKDHLDAVRTATESNSEHIRSLVASQQSSAKSDRSSRLDFSPLTERLNRIHSTLEKQAERSELNQGTGTGDAKFLMNALTSHLSKIQGVTEQNAQHVKSLREKQSSSSDKMHIAVSETSEQVRSLIQRNQENEARIESQNSQMRELMSGQREMVEVMRQLAKNIAAQNKGTCDHIVVPPPRKMGRKVVGFVYDAKEGTP